MKKSVFNSRRFKHGTLATVLTVVFVAAVVLVNIIATVLLEKFPLSIDLTKEQSYALADDSKEFLKTIDTDVKIYVLGEEALFNTGDFYHKQLLGVLKQCAQYNSKVDLQFVDLTKNPQFANKYAGAEVQEYSIIVESDLRYKVFSDYTQLFDVDYSNAMYGGSPIITSSHAELDMMSALMYVTDKDPVKIGILTGFAEVGVDGLKELLEANAYTFEEVNILAKEIPSELDTVIIPAPTKDYEKTQVENLEKFLNNGGKYGKNVIYLASMQQQTALPRLEGYLKSDWGIQVDSGIVVESDSNKWNLSWGQYMPYYISHELSENDYTGSMDSVEDPIIMPFPRPLTAAFDSQNGTTTTALLTTGETCVLQPIDADENWSIDDQEKKAFTTAISSVRLKYEDETNAELTSKVIAFGSAETFDAGLLKSTLCSNGDFAVSVANTLTGKTDNNNLNIVAKTENTGTIDITETTVMVMMVIFVIIVPVAVFVTGLVIWLRRRHR